MERCNCLKHALSVVLLATILTGRLFAQDITLPAPQKSGGMPLMEALAKRSTTKTAFDSRELSNQQLSSLLWSCFGINRPDGKRTAPSANDKRATGIYVLLKSGAYVYDAPGNKLNQVECSPMGYAVPCSPAVDESHSPQNVNETGRMEIPIVNGTRARL